MYTNTTFSSTRASYYSQSALLVSYRTVPLVNQKGGLNYEYMYINTTFSKNVTELLTDLYFVESVFISAWFPSGLQSNKRDGDTNQFTGVHSFNSYYGTVDSILAFVVDT